MLPPPVLPSTDRRLFPNILEFCSLRGLCSREVASSRGSGQPEANRPAYRDRRRVARDGGFVALGGAARTPRSPPSRLDLRLVRRPSLTSPERKRCSRKSATPRTPHWPRVGRLRGEWETRSFPEVSALPRRTAAGPARPGTVLSSGCGSLEAKGSADLEINPDSARRAWEEARELATELGEPARASRAFGRVRRRRFPWKATPRPPCSSWPPRWPTPSSTRTPAPTSATSR